MRIAGVDEKTGMQALERKAITPMKQGQVARHDNEYTRHGTQCLIANLEVATGRVIASTVRDTRTEQDFFEHIRDTVNTDPAEQWIFIADQLNTHKRNVSITFIPLAE